MQGYTSSFARIYNRNWAGFATQLAPRILDYYRRESISQQNQTLLDVCCGTGQLAAYFLQQGFRVIGIDLSAGMLHYANENNAAYVQTGQARFIQADAAAFTLDEQVGLVVSTFDALNHLENEAALRHCFECVYAALVEGGCFIFDLNTRIGLRRWNSISVEDTEEAMIVNRGFYDEQAGRATAHISGFMRTESGGYERFEVTAYNTVFDLSRVKAALEEAGWREVYFARGQDLTTPVAEPESEGRIFIVAQK